MIDIFSYILVGIGVGLLSSFLGFGGGTIIVPFLPLISGLDIKTTIATSLATVALNASNNTFNFHRKNKVRWVLVLTMCIGSMTFGFLSSKAINLINEYYVRWTVIAVFIVLTLITHFGIKTVPKFLRQPTTFNLVLMGAFAGIASGFGGIGGGTFLIPILIVGQWVENDEVSPAGNAINMLTAGTAALTLAFSNQRIEWLAAIIILLTSLAVSHFARQKQHLMSDKQRRYAIVYFLSFTILLQIYKTLNV
jgi:uncharacterized membrane protein YfcA